MRYNPLRLKTTKTIKMTITIMNMMEDVIADVKITCAPKITTTTQIMITNPDTETTITKKNAAKIRTINKDKSSKNPSTN